MLQANIIRSDVNQTFSINIMLTLMLSVNFRLKEVQASDKSEMQALQKQVKDLQSGNTVLQHERDKLSEDLQVIITVQCFVEFNCQSINQSVPHL